MSRRVVAGAALIASVLMWLVISWPKDEQAEQDSVPAQAVSFAPPPPASPPPDPPPTAATGVGVGVATAKEAPPSPSPEALRSPDEPPPVYAQPEPPQTGGSLGEVDRDLGPVAEYRKQYDSEARDSAAHEIETHIRSAFEHSRTPDLFQLASCRENICKVLMRWSPARTRDYITSAAWLGVGGHKLRDKPQFDVQVALTPVTAKQADGTRLVELYLKRRQPMAAN